VVHALAYTQQEAIEAAVHRTVAILDADPDVPWLVTYVRPIFVGPACVASDTEAVTALRDFEAFTLVSGQRVDKRPSVAVS
jgi:hypothetical protein